MAKKTDKKDEQNKQAQASDADSDQVDPAEKAKQDEQALWEKENLTKPEIKKAMAKFSPKQAQKVVKKITPDEIKEKLIDYSDDDINKAITELKGKGYVTKQDFKQMKNPVWVAGFFNAIEDKVQNDDSFNPFLYWDSFNYRGGVIETIIYNMDKKPVSTRAKADATLAQATGKKMIQVKGNVEKNVKYSN